MSRLGLAVSLAGCIAAVGWAQSSRAEFEVASVKPADQLEKGQNLSFVGASNKPFQITGSRVTIRGTLKSLIMAAYDVWTYQVAGEPAWADNVIYIVTAKAEGDAPPTQDAARPMLQALLAERFGLKMHREARVMPVYHLMPGKKNIGLKPAGPNETFSWKLSPAEGGMLRSKATKESIGDFVKLVGVSADSPVIDKTGMTGDIDYDIIIYTQDAKNNDDVNRGILDAVKDQLGLKLEPARDSIEVLVVDAAEKASDN
jgi:uncharacterized protein (TIGR03435 family)